MSACIFNREGKAEESREARDVRTARGPDLRLEDHYEHCNRLLSIIAGILIFLLFAANNLNAQSNTRLGGTVVAADDGTAVPHAEVSVVGTSYSATTDEAGMFAFDNVPLGTYRIQITAPGFIAKEISDLQLVSDITRRIRITLAQKIYSVDDVMVKGKRRSLTGGVTVVDRRQIERLHPEVVSDILETVEGVLVERTGPGGQATIRIRGGSPNQVLVLLDGHRLNASSSGVADLNSVPVSVVERIELHKSGASAQFGPDAMAGVVNIITQPSATLRPASVDATIGEGSFGTQRQCMNLELPINSVNLNQRLTFEDRSSDGDFDYAYHVSPGDAVYRGPRINNESQSRSLFGSGRWSHRGTRLGYSYQVYDASNGLPGKASLQDDHAYREDDRRFLSIQLEHQFSSALDLSLSGGYSRNIQFFANPNQYETRYTDKGVDIKGDVTYRVLGLHELRAGYQYQRNKLNHEDLMRDERFSIGITRRRTNSFFVSGRHPFDLSRSGLLNDLTLTASLRYDNATTDPEKKQIPPPFPMTRHVVRTESWSPRIGAAITRGEELRFVAQASWGRSLRLPSISSLFWRGDTRSAGNPDLKPERAEHLDGGLVVRGEFGFVKFAAGVTAYRKDVEDLVVWIQSTGGVFKPQNLGIAEITGHEDFVRLSFLNDVFEIAYGNSVTHALNKQPGNNYDKTLTYTPRYVTTLSLRLDYRIMFASYDIRSVGRRYALAGNEKWYDAYRLHDLAVGSRIDVLAHWRVRIDGKIENLGDEPYVLISQHPMPGRAYNLSLTVSYKP